MKAGSLVAIAAAIAVTCQTVPASAQNRGDGQWRDIPPYEITVNIIDLREVDVWKAQQRIRDNAVLQQQAFIGDGAGRLLLHHAPSYTDGVSEHAAMAYQEAALSRKAAVRFWSINGEPFDYEESRKIYNYGERAGWVHMTRSRTSSRRCIIARVAFLSDQAKGSLSPSEVYDSVVSLDDCSGKRTLRETVEWLKNLKIVPVEYNRRRN